MPRNEPASWSALSRREYRRQARNAGRLAELWTRRAVDPLAPASVRDVATFLAGFWARTAARFAQESVTLGGAQ